MVNKLCVSYTVAFNYHTDTHMHAHRHTHIYKQSSIISFCKGPYDVLVGSCATHKGWVSLWDKMRS